MPGKMIHEKSSDTKVIENVLSELAVGDLITYDQISAAIGRDVRKFAFPSLGSARRFLLHANSMVFGVERGVGLRRLNDSEIVSTVEDDRRKVQRASHRSLKKLSVVNYSGLTNEDKRRHTVAAAQIGAIAMFASKNSEKKIASHVKTQETVAIGETLKLFT